MKNYRFYLEYPTNKDKCKGTRANLGNHSGTVLALPLENDRPLYIGTGFKHITMGCVSSVQDFPNNPVCTSACCTCYLSSLCKRISEKQARVIHPALFEYLEYEP